MRIALFSVVIVGLCIYAWRNWYIPVCVLVIMDAVMKYDDMPRSVLGVPGANPWNVLLASSLLAWMSGRMRGKTHGDLPRNIAFVLMGFLFVIFFAFLRGVIDVSSIPDQEPYKELRSFFSFTTEYLINPFKYLVAAFLLFDGARTCKNLLLGLAAIFSQAGLYALRVVRNVPPRMLLEPDNPFRHRISRECGLHANDMALVMVVAFWGIVACFTLWPHVKWHWRIFGLSGMVGTLMALGLTQSRGGFMAFVGTGLLFGVLRHRVLLIIFPLLLLVVAVAFPSVTVRLSEGVGEKNLSGQEGYDADALTGGRLTNLWPHVVTKIAGNPIIGFGRLAIVRTDLFGKILTSEGNVPLHPHNAYLEMLLDSGIVGLFFALGLYAWLPIMAASQGRPAHPALDAAIGTGLAGCSSVLIASLSGQTFFPREGIFIVLCTFAVMLRAHLIQVQLRNAVPVYAPPAIPPRRVRRAMVEVAVVPEVDAGLGPSASD